MTKNTIGAYETSLEGPCLYCALLIDAFMDDYKTVIVRSVTPCVQLGIVFNRSSTTHGQYLVAVFSLKRGTMAPRHAMLLGILH